MNSGQNVQTWLRDVTAWGLTVMAILKTHGVTLDERGIWHALLSDPLVVSGATLLATQLITWAVRTFGKVSDVADDVADLVAQEVRRRAAEAREASQSVPPKPMFPQQITITNYERVGADLGGGASPQIESSEKAKTDTRLGF